MRTTPLGDTGQLVFPVHQLHAELLGNDNSVAKIKYVSFLMQLCLMALSRIMLDEKRPVPKSDLLHDSFYITFSK